jgi:hypothetical protein
VSPFALGTWSVIGNIGAGITPPSPFNVAYSASRDILVAGVCGSGAILSWNPGAIFRSVNQGVTWTLVHDFNATPGPDGFNGAPVALALLRDPITGDERFVAAVVRISFFITSPESSCVRMWWSDDGVVWTPGTQIVDAPGAGAATTGTGSTSIATRPRGGRGATTLEHYIIAEAHRNAVTSRGVFTSTDLGLTWTLVGDTAVIGSINGGNNTTALVTMPDRHLLLGNNTTLGGSAHTEDGGQSWRAASPQFDPDYCLAFDPGTIVGVRRGTLTTPGQTRICCDDNLSWPPGNVGPTFGLSGATVTLPVIINLGNWEVILAAGTTPLGKIDMVYSDNGGETAAVTALLDTGSGIIAHLAGGVMLADGRPLIVVGSTGVVLRSSETPAHVFGTRIYCTAAPAPGVGFVDVTPACGPFYDVCPQPCPDDPELAAAQLIPLPPDFIAGEAFTWGDASFTYGMPSSPAIWGGSNNISLSFPVLTRLSGCGATFVCEPCAVEACP